MRSNTTHVKPPFRVLVLLFVSIAYSTTSFSQVLFNSSFEGSNPFQGATNNQSCCSHSVTASTAQAHHGTQSFRAEVRANDPAVSSGYRAELTFPNIPDQGDMWYGWSMFFEPNNSANTDWTGCCGHVVQWHPSSSSGGAVLDLRADGGRFDFCVNPAGGGSTTHQPGTLQDIVPNRWYDIVMHVNWAASGGLLEVWLDGVLYYRRNVDWTSGRYFKFGMNRWNMSNTWTIYYDNLKIGRNVTYNDVAPTPTTPTNQAPVARAGNDITITLPTVIASLNGSASTDADGTIQNYSWSYVSGPLGSLLATPLTALTSVTGLLQGTYTFRLTVTDDDGATSTDDVRVIVNPLIPPPNTPPIASAGNNQTITLPTNSVTVNGNGSTDSDGSIQSYLWSWVSGPTGYTITNPNSVSTTITGLAQGTYAFRLRVTDDDGASTTDDMVVTVNPAPPPPNQPPAANAGNNITITLPVSSTTLNGSNSSDADGTIQTYLWTWISGPTGYSITNANAAATGLTGLVQGTYTFRLRVTDDDGASSTDDVVVTVNPATPPPNQPPVANAGNNVTITLPTNSVTLNGSNSTDADGNIVSYVWSWVNGPATYSITNTGAVSTTVTGLGQGIYTFRLQVTDDDGATATDDIVITVNAAPPPPNQPPVARAGTDIVITLPVNSVTLNGSNSTDADGTITSYAWTWTGGPTTYSITNANAAATGVTGLVQGVYTFRLTVRDDDNATAFDDIRVTVNAAPPPPPPPPPANQGPVANAGNEVILYLPVNSTALYGSGSTDPDGLITAYEWTQLSGPSQVVIANNRAANIQVSDLMIGEYQFRLTVTDNSGASATATVRVIVRNRTGEELYCNVYPNPTRNTINIRYISNNTGNVRIVLYDANKRYVFGETVAKHRH
jgi:hypothetical protein